MSKNKIIKYSILIIAYFLFLIFPIIFVLTGMFDKTVMFLYNLSLTIVNFVL